MLKCMLTLFAPTVFIQSYLQDVIISFATHTFMVSTQAYIVSFVCTHALLLCALSLSWLNNQMAWNVKSVSLSDFSRYWSGNFFNSLNWNLEGMVPCNRWVRLPMFHLWFANIWNEEGEETCEVKSWIIKRTWYLENMLCQQERGWGGGSRGGKNHFGSWLIDGLSVSGILKLKFSLLKLFKVDKDTLLEVFTTKIYPYIDIWTRTW